MNHLSDEDVARLHLLSSIEGNSTFWAHQVRQHGAVEVVNRLRARSYEGTKHAAEKISDRLNSTTSEQLIDQLADAFFITPDSPDWPMRLNELAAPPFGLVGLGIRDILTSTDDSLGIVGTRNPTNYGSKIATEFAAALADRNWTIVSGGAFGIDTAAHRGALIVEGNTIAVLGGGVRTIFPSGNGFNTTG